MVGQISPRRLLTKSRIVRRPASAQCPNASASLTKLRTDWEARVQRAGGQHEERIR